MHGGVEQGHAHTMLTGQGGAGHVEPQGVAPLAKFQPQRIGHGKRTAVVPIHPEANVVGRIAIAHLHLQLGGLGVLPVGHKLGADEVLYVLGAGRVGLRVAGALHLHAVDVLKPLIDDGVEAAVAVVEAHYGVAVVAHVGVGAQHRGHHGAVAHLGEVGQAVEGVEQLGPGLNPWDEPLHGPSAIDREAHQHIGGGHGGMVLHAHTDVEQPIGPILSCKRLQRERVEVGAGHLHHIGHPAAVVGTLVAEESNADAAIGGLRHESLIGVLPRKHTRGRGHGGLLRGEAVGGGATVVGPDVEPIVVWLHIHLPKRNLNHLGGILGHKAHRRLVHATVVAESTSLIGKHQAPVHLLHQRGVGVHRHAEHRVPLGIGQRVHLGVVVHHRGGLVVGGVGIARQQRGGRYGKRLAQLVGGAQVGPAHKGVGRFDVGLQLLDDLHHGLTTIDGVLHPEVAQRLGRTVEQLHAHGALGEVVARGNGAYAEHLHIGHRLHAVHLDVGHAQVAIAIEQVDLDVHRNNAAHAV